MSWFEALVLGLLQGLTEFLPISSSGHLVIGKELFGIQTRNISFEIVVHAATVLSTITVFRKDILRLLSSLFKFKYNKDTQYLLMLALSMLPVLIVGVFFKSQIEVLFGEGLGLVGGMLLVTAVLLLLAQVLPSGHAPIKYKDAFLIGLSQAAAVLPGLSRSGTTIATGLLLGKDRAEVARFSFLMVLVPILGEAFLELMNGGFSPQESGISTSALVIGFIAAYIAGCMACSWMISLVKRAKLWGFSLYCALAGVFCLIYYFLN